MITFRHPGTVLTDRFFAVPLDHQRPDGEQIEVFAREVVAADKADADLPWLLFLQGGPGFGAQRPEGRDSWLNRALEDYRVLLLDQRGTGRSSPANRKTLARLAAAGPQAQADYLTHFRADSIVLDAELIRRELTGEPWSVLGQSFGGMCAVTYLSFAPHGVREAFITGGLPGLTATADDVYRHTYRTVAAKNAAHYERYPQDADMARRVADYLDTREVRLPDGAPLTVRAFQSAGVHARPGRRQPRAALPAGGPVRRRRALRRVPVRDDGPAQLRQRAAVRAAARGVLRPGVRDPVGGAADQGRVRRVRPRGRGSAPLYFTGEMIYPWMIDADPVLRPLRQAAGILAERDDWPPLYDPARLAANEVPAAAAVYYNDMYVDRELSMQTARAIRGLRTWVTSEYEHDGLRVSDGAVLDRLIGMVRGNI